ncbi:hypothetical protein [Novosphingobium resinovorum]|uniref:hypothetical protein n=1 Tax=Novosphingobium resinovorum TaxID=158500 RepID=UPI002ED30079|nr:hypothetical protein [Novosphingobium resinovorum]
MAETAKILAATSIVNIAMGDQAKAQRIIEMARIIEEVSDDLPPDCESSRLRACAQVIYESAEALIANLERIEAAIGKSSAPSAEVAA